ncbi:NACHT domain-containing protein [Fusarium keratoplasticum]|nr:NACHT domain-containing protein [Fusarium keratoplasticum]
MNFLSASSSQDVVSSQRASRQADQTAAVKDLENTIARFQAILTDDDRKNLQQLKTEPHDAQSIIMFTASLDRFDPKRRGKSVASRLASFLQTIEQFTPIADTYIQSNPEIAALVWGSVKLTFQLLANFTSYFQSFVELLSGFGSLCSRFAEYHVIFKDSPRLKTSICVFHSSVVNCCEKIVLVTRRLVKSQAWMAITQSFQSEIRGYVDDIKSKAETVRDDIQLAKAQSDSEEHQLQAKARQKAEENYGRISSLLKKARSEMRLIGEHGTRGTAEQRRRRLLKDLSSHNYTSAFNNARNKRHLGTAEWAFNTDQFRNWLTGDGPAVLHVTGKIGSGKTILASSIVEHLCQIRQPNQFISFFFSRFDNSTTLASDTIIRSLVQQLLSVAPMETMNATLASEIADCLQKTQDNFFSLDTLGKLYETASKFTQDWFILIDGVDECESEQQRLLYDFLSRFLDTCSGPQRIRILFSSRETTKQEIEKSFDSVGRLITGTSNTSADIVAFAEDVIVAKLARGELVVRDPEIIGDILQAIASKEEGMFLWAFLAIEDICSGTNDKEIREALQEIPTDLPTTFDRALSRIAKRRNQKIASEIFGWTTAARQPLTLAQLQEALSVKVGQRNLHPDDLVSGIDRITVWCENLVCVEETDNTVHFSHHSIREYLLQSESGDLKDFHVDLEEFDHHAGEVCITYLHLENLKTALIESEKAEPPPTVTVAMEGLSEQTVRTAVGGSLGARVGRWTSRVVKSSARAVQPSAGDVAIHSTLGNLRYAPPASRGIEYVFLEYAEDNWFRHRTRLVRTSGPAENSMWNLVGRLLRSPRQSKNLPWKDLRWRESITTWGYLNSPFEDPSTSFVPSGRFFIPHETERHMQPQPTPGPMSDLSTIGSLPFLAVYAVQNTHESLACCAFMSFIQKRQRSPITKWLTLYLALEGKHSSCPNHCFARLQEHLFHYELVQTITLCIAAGVSHWPASASKKVIDDEQHRQCSTSRFLDFCKLIPTGYVAQDDMYIRDFALVALCAVSNPVSFRLPGSQNESSGVLTARTSNKMSIVDIAVEQNDLSSLNFLISFFQIHFQQAKVFGTAKHPGEIEKLALGGLYTALQNGSSENAKFLFKQCVDLFSSEQAGQFEQLDIINLHLALSQAAVFEWPFDTTKNILSWFFEKLVVKRNMEAAMNHLIEESVKAGNWKFAAAVVDAVSDLEFERTESDDPFFKMTLDSLNCQRCRGRQSWPEPMDTQLLFADQRYKLCSKHKRQALATLDARLYLAPDKASLQLARLSESDQEKLPPDTEIEEDSIVSEPVDE